MATKKELDNLLGGGSSSKKPIIRRGQGLRLSTDESRANETQPEETKASPASLPPQPETSEESDAASPPLETETVPDSQSLVEETRGASAEPGNQPPPKTSSESVSVPEQSQKRIKAKSQNRTNAKSQVRTNAKTQKSSADLPVRLKRVNRGYKLREDLIKSCKRIALEEDRKLYEVMEEALALYVAQKGY